VQAVRAIGLSKQFGTTRAVDRVDLAIAQGELFTLLGPSGCGKTTLLRLLAGLEEPSGGEIRFGETRVDNRPVYQRNVGMVFQSYALFPHMSVAENVAYGLRARGIQGKELRDQVAEALASVGLADHGERTPGQLSGGQQQRVALARALVTRPALLLMDEPFSNLDARLRIAMRMEVRRIVKEAGITTVYVTHDQEEALAISDRIGVMQAGRLIQVDGPVAIYRSPAHQSVAAFVGSCSFLTGDAPGITLGIRPEHARIRPVGEAAPPDTLLLEGEVAGVTYLGAASHVLVRVPSGETVTALSLDEPGSYQPGSPVRLHVPRSALLRFDAQTGEAVR